ncbi:2-oxo acid dehydrogenase subunit E2 [Runella sp. MFBS21]|uniref:2-oxo acid dehydrogenase subunit E2 n=1 Tax=Runella sp. MFBS21 TaxID=3034018 RepID=UPI0023F61DF4|nr:2-oxo acid dehydrogenase subunit E2 [Runella sp. MFBS21]MDF7818418.1 2-oxo acid dehydrogenase subunit E2 [Runella sp. MFBS21]
MTSSNDFNTNWRKVASTIYDKPTDSKIFGSVEIDITDLESYIKTQRKAGIKVTLTHFFLLATARAIKEEIPEFNTYWKRGNIYPYPHIDATVSVLMNNGEMGSVKVEKIDTYTLPQLVEVLRTQIQIAQKGDDKAKSSKDLLAKIPWPFRKWVYGMIRYLTVHWGISIPSLGLSASNFGAFFLSNIGSIGLDIGYPALFPSANVSFVLIMGGVSQKPWVVEGQVVPRTIMTLGAALDHRIIDASHGGKLFRFLKKMVAQPTLLEKNKA